MFVVCHSEHLRAQWAWCVVQLAYLLSPALISALLSPVLSWPLFTVQA